MNISNIFKSSSTEASFVEDSLKNKEQVNNFYSEIFNKAKGDYQIIDKIEQVYNDNGLLVSSKPIYKTISGNNEGEWTLSEFLNLQKTSESSAELASYCDTQGLTFKSLGSNAGEMLNKQINTQAALQVIQNFYDMYISPVGNTDIKYRLGEVTGKAVSGTVNNQTDEYGRLRTRSLYNTKVDYQEWLGSSLVAGTEYYSVLWFPPFKPIDVKATSWKGVSATTVDKATGLQVDSSGYLLENNGKRIKAKLQSDGYIYYTSNNIEIKQYIGTAAQGYKVGSYYNFKSTDNSTTVNTLSMSEYLEQSKAKRQEELEEKNKELLENGETVEAEDSRLPVSGVENKYYDTFDMNNFLAARSSFTYRAPGFKAINDNINMLQWILEGISGITSTFLTEWDISLYLQEGLISDSQGTLPNVITLTHRMDSDNPSGYSDSKACVWGVLNCAVSKLYGHNQMTWTINAYPYSAWHTLYPDPTKYSGWLDKVTDESGDTIYIPNFYRYGKNGLDAFIAGSDITHARGDSVQSRLMYQDFEGAALSGWTDWNFENKMWKTIYTSADDGFSDIDLIFLQTSSGLYKKRDLINSVQETIYGTSEDASFYDGSDMVVAGSNASGNNDTNTEIEYGDLETGSGGNKWCPSSVFKGALTFLKLFNKRSSTKNAALSQANSMSDTGSGNTYGALQDSLGLVAESKGQNNLSDNEKENYLLGTDKKLLDNSNGLGVAQYSPVLYGGPHSYYRSPRSYQSYYQENSLYLRNIPRVDKCPDNFSHDSWAGINYPSLPSNQDDYYYKGNEKWCSNVAAVENGERQAFEQSWSAGLSRLKEGIHHWSNVPTYLKVRLETKVEGTQRKIHQGRDNYRWETVFPEYAPNGEKYEYIDKYCSWDYKRVKFNSNYWDSNKYYDYASKYEYIYISSWGNRVEVYYRYPFKRAYTYVWRYTYFKRYVLHSEPNLNWKIVQTQSYNSYLANNSTDNFASKWRSTFRNLFGYSRPYEELYQSGHNEDYELFIDTGGRYSTASVYDEKLKQQMTFWMTGDEHRILTNIVDWGGGLGAHNKAMFLTRDAKGNPDCLFRVNLVHKEKPIYYWEEHSKTYSSRKKKYWWEKHNKWKHYIAVELHSCDRFYAGLSKPSFTNYGSSSNGEGAWGASSPSADGTITSAQLYNSIIYNKGIRTPTDMSCVETRKSPYDLLVDTTMGRDVPYYDPTIIPDNGHEVKASAGSDIIQKSYKAISGKGIIGDIPGLDYIGNGGVTTYGDKLEDFTDKLCSDQMRYGNYNATYNTAFKYITFPMWQIANWRYAEKSYHGNTYHSTYGFPTYRKISAPSWWNSMILNMSLRNTFYRGDTNGPLKATFDISDYNIDVNNLAEGAVFEAIANRKPTVHASTGTFEIRLNDIKTYSTVQKTVTTTASDGSVKVEIHPIVKTVTLKNAWSAAKYYFTSYDIAPRFLYNMLSTQSGYLSFAKDFICGRTAGAGGKKGDYILSFDFIREIMEGNSSTDGLISPRTYYLADPKKEIIKDPSGTITLPNGELGSYCSDMYGYNPWIKVAREWFCNSKSENALKHQQIEDELNKRISIIEDTKKRIINYVGLNMSQYSYNTMIASWRALNEFIDLKYNETTEMFLLAYLNVLYEARRYFINKRCNKQDGTLWACRHLEKMLPQVLASAVAASSDINTTAFGGSKRKENVAFYELNNTLAKKVGALKDNALNDSNTSLETDKIKTVYVKVKYASLEDYNNSLAKIKDGTISKIDERIVPVQPIAFVKKSDGTWKNKANGDTLNEGEQWNENGYAIKKGKIKYAVKPADGLYKLYSKEKHTDEDNLAKRQQNPKGNYIVHNYDEAKWNIDWSAMAEKNQILYNYFGGVNVSTLKDLTQKGELDPQAVICGAKESADYWIIPVRSTYPRTEGYKTQLTLEMIKEGEFTVDEIASTENSVALVGAAAYAMWPIIEDQTDVIPNSGDLANALGGLTN